MLKIKAQNFQRGLLEATDHHPCEKPATIHFQWFFKFHWWFLHWKCECGKVSNFCTNKRSSRDRGQISWYMYFTETQTFIRLKIFRFLNKVDLVITMYYAPWSTESREFKHKFEIVAKAFKPYSEVKF